MASYILDMCIKPYRVPIAVGFPVSFEHQMSLKLTSKLILILDDFTGSVVFAITVSLLLEENLPLRLPPNLFSRRLNVICPGQMLMASGYIDPGFSPKWMGRAHSLNMLLSEWLGTHKILVNSKTSFFKEEEYWHGQHLNEVSPKEIWIHDDMDWSWKKPEKWSTKLLAGSSSTYIRDLYVTEMKASLKVSDYCTFPLW